MTSNITILIGFEKMLNTNLIQKSQTPFQARGVENLTSVH